MGTAVYVRLLAKLENALKRTFARSFVSNEPDGYIKNQPERKLTNDTFIHHLLFSTALDVALHRSGGRKKGENK